MRNVTDKKALPGAKPDAVKRGRGRPPKPDAMSNAERQAAWRARQRDSVKSVTVTKIDLAKERERLRDELAKARREVDAASRKTRAARAPSDVAAVLQRALPKDADPDAGERSLRLVLSNAQFFALERLVTHFDLSRRAVIERLLSWADDGVSRSFGDDDAAFNRYIDRRNEK
jgi:hypothetical protein